MFIPQECGICNVGLAYFDGNSTLDNPGIKHRDWIGVRCEEVHSQDAEPFAGSKGVIAVAYVDIDDYSQLTTDPNSLFIGTYQNLLHSDKTTLIPDFSISSLFMFQPETTLAHGQATFISLAVEGLFDDWRNGNTMFKCTAYNDVMMIDTTDFSQVGWDNERATWHTASTISQCIRHSEFQDRLRENGSE